jgi:hypothetical protein
MLFYGEVISKQELFIGNRWHCFSTEYPVIFRKGVKLV